MMKKLILLACCSLLSMTTWAVKADPTPVTITQSDGTQLTVMGYGDEDFHWYTTTDGVLLVRQGYDYHVATIDKRGEWKASGMLAHESGKRSVNEQMLIKRQDKALLMSKAREQMRKAQMAKISPGNPSPMYFPHEGKPKVLVLLVQFSDVKFLETDPYQSFNDYLSGEAPLTDYGLRENRNYGSVRQYFHDMSDGQFEPQFDLVGPITLDETSAYYGAGSDNINDLLKDACRKAMNEKGVNFADYDSDGDGAVDLLYIIYAGFSASVGGNSEDDIWPKSGVQNITEKIKVIENDKEVEKTVNVDFNGIKVRRYGVNNELNYSPNKKYSEGPNRRINGIGLFCHEFSHTMGLPDFYPKDNAAKLDNQTMEYWDLMDGGEYTDNGYRPTPYTPWEKEVMGWKMMEVLSEPQHVGLKADEARKIECEGSDQYVIVHNVQGLDIEGDAPSVDGWGGKMMGHGLVVYRVDYRRNAVNLGDYPNNTPGVPGFTVVPADGLLITSYRIYTPKSETNPDGGPTPEKPWSENEYKNSHYGDPYPGTENVTEIGSIALNNGIVLNKPIYNIKENRATGVVSFDFLEENILESFQVDDNNYDIKDRDNYIVEVSNMNQNLSEELEIPASVTYENEEYTVTSIAPEGYTQLDITSVTIPDGIEAVGEHAFAECPNIESVTIMATVPPTAFTQETDDDAEGQEAKAEEDGSATGEIAFFDENVYHNAILFVPEGCIEAYKAADGWKQFATILEIGTIVNDIHGIPTAIKTPQSVFTIDGRRINSHRSTLAPGIYIIDRKKMVVR